MEKIRPRGTNISTKIDWDELEISEQVMKTIMETRPRKKHIPVVKDITKSILKYTRKETEELF